MLQKSISNAIVFRTVLTGFMIGCFIISGIVISAFWWVLALAAVALLGAVIIWSNRLFSLIFCAILGILVGVFYCGIYQNRLISNPVYGNECFEGQILYEPEQGSSYQQIIIKPDAGNQMSEVGSGQSVSLKMDSTNAQSRRSPNLVIRATVYPQFKYGDIIEVCGQAEKPEAIDSQNGKSFDYPMYLLTKYRANAIIKKPDSVEYFSSGGKWWVKQVIKLRGALETASIKQLPEPEASLGSGLLTGNQGNFDPSFEQDLRQTGTSHITAVSGYNVTILTQVFFDWFRSLLGFWTAVPLSVVLVLGFVALTGAPSSVVRAAIMGAGLLVSKIIGRGNASYHILILTAFIMVLFNPLIVKYDTGFQLSFLAMAGLIFISPAIKTRLEQSKYYLKIPLMIRQAFEATVGAQIMTWPLLLVVFGQFSIVAPLVNLIVVPLVPYAMLLSSIAIAAYWVIPTIAMITSFIAYLGLDAIVKIIQGFSSIPWSGLQINNVGWWVLAIFYMIVVVWINREKIYTLIRNSGHAKNTKLAR